MTDRVFTVSLSSGDLFEIAGGLALSYVDNVKWLAATERLGFGDAAPQDAMAGVLAAADALPAFARKHFDEVVARRVDWLNGEEAFEARRSA